MMLALALVAAGQSFRCDAVALHDVDGPIHCASGVKIRLQGIGATETDGTCRPAQPCVAGNPMAQRRVMATKVIGARIAREDPGLFGRIWFAAPVSLQCISTGQSHQRTTAWCRRSDGGDLSCRAIAAGVAARWARYDPEHRLDRCASRLPPLVYVP